MALLGNLTVGILGDMSGYSDGLSKAQRETVKFSKKIEQTGKNISTIGYGFQDLGSKLTKMITVPAVAAGTALAGMTATLGWKRLVGLDTAKAQLKGLGYEGKDVDRIMEQVTSAIEGGMTTAAEGTAIAAGALAAGVEEGKELERYITLVGDAAVGANRPVDEMAMIFNRVQGSGELMTRELNMIEQGMPGFSQAMADNLDVAPEKLSEMVTAGEVSSKEFLDVMDDFAGGMAEAYSESWAGMTKNTLAYIGIIGESLLEGVFEDGKKSLAEFIEILKSDEVQQWAEKTGEKISQAFTTIVDKVSEVKQWYDELSPAMQDLTKKVALFGSIGAVAIGPFLLIVGKIIVTVGTLVTRFGAIAGAVTKLGGVFGVLTGPIGITIGIITALVAVGVLLYKNWETIKEKAIDVFSNFEPLIETVKNSFQTLKDSMGPTLENLKGLWESLLPILKMVGAVVGGALAASFGVTISTISAVMAALGPFINALINLVDFVVNIVNVIISLLKGDFTGAWDYLKDAGQSALDFIVNIFTGLIDFVLTFVNTIIDYFVGLYETLVGNSIIPDMVNAIVEWFKSMFEWVIDVVMSIVEGITNAFMAIYETVSNYLEMAWENVQSIWEYIQNTFENALDFLKALVTGDFEGMKNAIKAQMKNAQELLKNIWNAIDKFLSKTLGNIWTNVKNKFQDIKSNIENKISAARDAVFNKFKDMVSDAKSKGAEIVSAVKSKFDDTKSKIIDPIISARDKIRGIVDDIKGFFTNMKLKLPKIQLPKLPKFSLDGEFSLKPPSVPKIGVSWNAVGGIFRNPTIFNTANAGLQGVGEAGAEAIIPLNNNTLGAIGEMIAKTMPDDNNSRGDINVYQTINSPEPLTPSKTARLNKRAMQEIALRW